MVLGLSAVTPGGAIKLLFENILLVLLKPVLPADLPPASLWPFAVGAGRDDGHLLCWSVYAPYRLLLATQPLRVLRRDVVARARLPLKIYLPVACAVVVALLRRIDGRKYAVVGGSGGRRDTGAAVRPAGWMLLCCAADVDVATAAFGCQPTSASAVVNVESAFGVFAKLFMLALLLALARPP